MVSVTLKVLKHSLITIALLLVVGLTYVDFGITQANAETEGTIEIEIHILYIDQRVRNVNVTIIATLRPSIDPDTNNITLYVYRGGDKFINCTGKGNCYQGSETTTWRPWGNSISYPYDMYRMTFDVTVDLPDVVFRVNETACKALFQGPERDALESVWRVDEISLLENSSGIAIVFSRIEGWSTLIEVAVMSMYLLFAGSFWLDPSNLMSRLTVYLTITAFSLSFIIYLQPNLPWRPFFTLPELLVITVMGAVAFAGLFSMMSKGFSSKGYYELLCDIATLAASLGFWFYLLFIILPYLTQRARTLLNFTYIIANFLAVSGIVNRLVKHWRHERAREEERSKPILYAV